MKRLADIIAPRPPPLLLLLLPPLLLLLATVAPAQTQPGELRTYEGRYYVMHTDLGRDAAREAEIRMTRMAEEYHARTKDFSGAIRQKFPFYLFRSESDYHAAGGTPGSAGGYDPNTRRLMAIAGDEVDLRTWYTVQHEGFHQFAHAVIGGELPIWVNEGLAEYFGEAVFTGDGFVTGVVPQWRLQRIRTTFERGGFKPVPDVMLMSHAQWNAGLNRTNYDQAWTMVHFLVHAEDGAYQRPFAAFIRAVGGGRPWDRAWLETIGPAGGFEEKWRDYWTKLPDNPTADRYAEATVRILTSFLARATAQRQRFANFDEFAAAARTGEVKTGEADWLPPSVLQGGLRMAEEFQKRGDTFVIAPGIGSKPPQLVYQPKVGEKLVGRFTLKGGRMGQVGVEGKRQK